MEAPVFTGGLRYYQGETAMKKIKAIIPALLIGYIFLLPGNAAWTLERMV